MLKKALESGKTVWSVGIYDCVSARAAQAAGFEAVMTGGYGISASLLGLPDAELLTLTENVGVVSRVSASTNLAVIADIDTGYGNTINVLRSVAEFKKAGASAVIIEDQISPKRCAACVDETSLIDIEEAQAKIRAAREVASRDMLVIARTDAFDPAEAIHRAKAYVAAGADLIQPVSKTFNDFQGISELRQACGRPLSLQLLNWLEKLTVDQIEAVAGLATFSVIPLLTATRALMENLTELYKSKNSAKLPNPRMTMPEFNEFIGFTKMINDQKRFLSH